MTPHRFNVGDEVIMSVNLYFMRRFGNLATIVEVLNHDKYVVRTRDGYLFECESRALTPHES